MITYKLILQIIIIPFILLYGQRANPNGSDYTLGNLADDFQVNAPDSSSVFRASSSDVAYYDSGNFVVVWSDNRNGDSDIYGQLYSEDCSPKGANFRINDDQSNGQQYSPKVAFDYLGNFIVVWIDERNLDTYSNISTIYGQAFDITGNPSGNNFMVTHPDSIGNYVNSDIEFRTDGSFVVIWEEYFGGMVVAQIFSSNREKIGNQIVVHSNRYDSNLNPDLAINSNDDFAIALIPTKYTSGPILLQLFDKKGNKIDSTITFKSNSMSRPKLEYLNNDKLVLAWVENLAPKDAPFIKQRVSIQLLSTSGEILSYVIVVDSDTAYSFGDIELSSNTSNQFIVTWKRDYNIYAQRYNNNGENIEAPIVVNDKNDNSYISNPSISVSSSGNFIITWGNLDDLFYQHYSDTGEKIDNNKKMLLSQSGSPQSNSVIAVHSVGKYVIAWEDEKEGFTSIYARIYNELNRPISNSIKLVDDGVNTDQHYPSIAIGGDDKIFVVWYGRRGDRLNNAYGQLLSFNGEKIGVNIKISSTDDNWGAGIASGESNNFIVTWNHYTESGFGNGIYGQRFNNNGEILGAIFRVSEEGQGGSRSSVAVNYDDSFIVTWTGSILDRNEVILARRFTSEAVPLEKSFAVNLDERHLPHGLVAPVIIDSSGNVIVCWTEYISGADYGILYSKFNYSGPITITNTLLNGPIPKWFSKIPIDDNGNSFIVVWEEFIDGSYDVLAQQVGDSMGEVFRITNTSNGIQSDPNIKVMNNKIYSTWTDNRIENSGTDVWANVLSWDSPTAVNDKIIVDEFKLLQNYPNPFNPSTIISYEVGDTRFVTLKIFDVLGREVATLVNKRQSVGNYEVTFDASGLSSGFYFYKLNSGSYIKTMKMLLLK